MNELPKRKQIRLKDYDYSQCGCYFITICTKDRQKIFWEIVGADTIRPNLTECEKSFQTINPKLSEYGKIVDTAINAIPKHYPNMKIDKYVIMPDHIHLILMISNNEKNGQMISGQTISGQTISGRMISGRMVSAPTSSSSTTIMTVIGQMKRWVSKEIGFPIWQKSFYEHIIRDEKDYITKAEYIIKNPLKWVIEREAENERI